MRLAEDMGVPGAVILLRTHVFGERESGIMEELEASGIGQVVVAADESRLPLDVGSFGKLSVTRDACRALGLYCPENFAWRNGDYALYLARRSFPDATHIWLVEPDVEHSFPSFPDFFRRFEPHPEIDLLAALVRPAEPDWYWSQTMPGRQGAAWRCLFATVRASARAIDECLAARQRRSRSLRDRLCWPNDEVFMATQAAAAGLLVADLNAPAGAVYAPDTFGYVPIDGASAFRHAEPRIYHPVLHGPAYRARIDRHVAAADARRTRWQRRLQRWLPGYV